MLHSSLYEDLAAQLDTPMPPVPVGILDHHMHLGDAAATRAYVEAAKAYGVERVLGLAGLSQAREIRRAFGDFFRFCGWPPLRGAEVTPSFVDDCIGEIEKMREEGFVALKFKVVPGNDGSAPLLWLDDARLKPLFDRAAELGFCIQAHIAQPDAWFDRHYSDGRAGSKASYFRQVEYLLETYPETNYVGVHMGGWPEGLDYLEELMDRHANFHVDTSATKWTVRELSRRSDRAREFFIRNRKRILFGSDLVVQKSVSPSYYTSRFHVQRTMWETSARTRSMIKDPDSPVRPVINGLELPKDVLADIYWNNAVRVLSLETAPPVV